jgi:hypothetical protein
MIFKDETGAPRRSYLDDYADEMDQIPGIDDPELMALLGEGFDDAGYGETSLLGGSQEPGLEDMPEAPQEEESEEEIRAASRDLLLRRAKERQKRSDEFQEQAHDMRNRKL